MDDDAKVQAQAEEQLSVTPVQPTVTTVSKTFIETNRTDLPKDASAGLLRTTRMWGMGMLKSIGISFKNWYRGPITVKYPFERLEDFERSRWEVELTLDEDGHHKCTACMSCVKACSHHCIDIQVEVGEDRAKTIKHWKYELGACINCGLCVEACPFDAIHMNHNYELAQFTRQELLQDLIVGQPAAKPKRKGAGTAKDAGAKAGAVGASGLTDEEKAAKIAAAKERMAAKKAAEAATSSLDSKIPEIKLTPETPEEVLKENDPIEKGKEGDA